MKTNIGYVDLGASLTAWLRERLRSAPVQAAGAADLEQALGALAEGRCRTLMLEMADDTAPAAPDSDEICCGGLCLYPRARRVVRDGQEITLTPKEYDILLFLARNRGEVFTKEQIYQAVWDGEYLLDDSNIMAFIRKLRKKIEPNPDAPQYILTIWGIGYKLNDAL